MKSRTTTMRRALAHFAAAGVIALALTGCDSQTAAPSASPSALMSAAVAAQSAGDSATAKAKLEELVATADIAKDQNLIVTAYFNLGVLAQTDKDTQTAILNYKKALIVDPTYAPALFNIAIASTPINPEAAMTYYGIILSANNKDANSLFNLGLLKWNNNEKAMAVKYLKAAIEVSPELAKKVPAEIVLN